jgi:hypothetical protein
MGGFISSRYSVRALNGHTGSLVLYMQVFHHSVEKHLIVVENVQKHPRHPESCEWIQLLEAETTGRLISLCAKCASLAGGSRSHSTPGGRLDFVPSSEEGRVSLNQPGGVPRAMNWGQRMSDYS